MKGGGPARAYYGDFGHGYTRYEWNGMPVSRSEYERLWEAPPRVRGARRRRLAEWLWRSARRATDRATEKTLRKMRGTT